MHILIVEDESHLAEGLRYNLDAEGYSTDIAEDAETALEKLRGEKFDAVILDVMLPGMSGFDAVREMREKGDTTPVLMLTARGRPEDILEGLDAGADDYLPKPFDLNVFLARTRALLRRMNWNEAPSAPAAAPVSVNGRLIDTAELTITHGTEVYRLTLMESRLLEYLIAAEGRIVSRSEILEHVWQLAEDTDTRAIDNFIVRLRRYLEDDPANPAVVLTVRGIGYRFVFAEGSD
ncbi:MAG: response regulator transcription factor [Acidobacteriota bacterium]|nr:MAG: response regulator transcription factor [Acidobacteriota bacterium]